MRHGDDETLAQIAYWYYVQELSQEEIARRIGTSRSQVSRFLRAARRQQIVRFDIRYPMSRLADLEGRIRARFEDTSLREIIVAAPAVGREADPVQAGVLAVARATVDWLARHLTDGMTLGLSWGGTIQTVVDLAAFSRKVDVRIVQLAGEISLDPRHSGHDLVRDLASKIGGSYSYFNASAVVPSAELAQALAETPQVQQALQVGRAADISLLGIGKFATGTCALFLEQADITDAERREARQNGAIGQLGGRFFDREGRQAVLALHRRILSLDIDELKRIPAKVVVASGPAKLEPTVAALRGGLIDVLVIDDKLAERLAEDARNAS